jgi:hypothetical protein
MRRLPTFLLTFLLISTKWSVAALGDMSVPIDSLTLAIGTYLGRTNIARIGTTSNYVVGYIDLDTYHAFFRSVACDSTGHIGADSLSSFTWNSVNNQSAKTSLIVENNYALVAYTGYADNYMRIASLSVSDAGVFSGSVTKTVVGNATVASDPDLIRIPGTDFYLLAYELSTGTVIRSLSISSGTVTQIDSLISGSANAAGYFSKLCLIGNTDYFLVSASRADTGKVFSFTCNRSTGDLGSAFIDSINVGGRYGNRTFVGNVNTYSNPLFLSQQSDVNSFGNFNTFTVDSTNGNISAVIDAMVPSTLAFDEYSPFILRIGNGCFLCASKDRNFTTAVVDTATGSMGTSFTSTKQFKPATANYSSMIRVGEDANIHYILNAYADGTNWGNVVLSSFSVEGGFEGLGAGTGWPHIIAGLSDFSYVAGILKAKVKSIAGLE